MAIEDPQTYAEWFWKNSVEATQLNAEDIEKVLAPVAAELLSSIPDTKTLPPFLASMIEGLKAPKDPGWDNVLVRFVGEVGSSLLNRVLGHEIKGFDYHMNAYLQNVLMTPDVANQLMLRKRITPELWLERMNAGGFAETEANLLYETLKPYPALPDIISWARYHGDPNNPKSLAWERYDISDKDWTMWEWLSRMKLNTEQVQTLYKRGVFTTADADTELARIGWQGLDQHHIKSLAHIIPNPMLMVQGDLIAGKGKEQILDDISMADIHPTYAETYLNAVLTKPQSIDLVAYELRQDPSLNKLESELQRIGIHPDYTKVYKELAYQIPPVADIITMAVREAFTPSIAARFGQYEDLPPDFVTWAQKKGLTKEWAERYWAAHWSLPSPQQGFEMLHRGVIDQSDLHLLLRASDIMPFWRDKLVDIAYQPLTRVDVRRMYKAGVLDVGGVRKAYRDLGYNEYNAGLMTDFTVEWSKGTPKKLSTTAIITAYMKHLIEAGELRSRLTEAETDEEDIQGIIDTAQQKRAWADKEEQASITEYKYKQGRISDTAASSELSNLGFTSDYIANVITLWTAKSVSEKESLWTTSQTLSFYKKNLIDQNRLRKELDLLGYDEEHINVYIDSLKPPT